jgi:hypothetical protein
LYSVLYIANIEPVENSRIDEKYFHEEQKMSKAKDFPRTYWKKVPLTKVMQCRGHIFWTYTGRFFSQYFPLVHGKNTENMYRLWKKVLVSRGILSTKVCEIITLNCGSGLN